MKPEKILERARIKYPIGTEFIPFNLEFMDYGIKTQIISGEIEENMSCYNSPDIKDAIWADSGDYMSVIYNEGEWAKIIKSK